MAKPRPPTGTKPAAEWEATPVPWRASLAGLVCLAAGSLASCGQPAGQFFVVQNQSPEAGCTIPTGAAGTYQGEGTLDIRVPASSDAAYMLFPLLENDLPAAGGGGPEPNRIALSGFEVELAFVDGSADAAAAFAAISADSATAGLMHFQTPWSGSVTPGGGRTSAGTSAFPAETAIRLRDSGALSLNLAGEPPPTIPAVDACRATSTWTAGADQTWDTRPTYDCSHHVAATVSGGQLSWQLDAGFANGGVLDVAIVPDPADTTPYALSFAPPTAASFQPDDSETIGVLPPPPPAAGPTSLPGATGGSGTVPAAPAIDAPAAAPPVVANASPGAAPQIAAAPAAATREPGSRAAGAAALAAFAFILLVRSFVPGSPRGHVPRSLLQINREGA